MEKLFSRKRNFRKYLYPRYTTDVTFQQSYRSVGSLPDGKLYSSTMHKLYSYKVKMSILHFGLAINTTNPYTVSALDLEILRNKSNSS